MKMGRANPKRKHLLFVTADGSLPQPPPKRFIVGPWYDSVFFIFAPLIALLMGYLAARLGGYDYFFTATDDSGEVKRIAVAMLLSSAFTHAHLFIVFFRSHGNPAIFKLYPARFMIIPPVLFVSCLVSQWVFVMISVLATWWDVYHSSLQTFGLGRIYDMRAGNDPNTGRRADFILNLILYTGPVLAGTSFAAHLLSFRKFEKVNGEFFLSFADKALERSLEIRTLVILLGVLFTVYYLMQCLRLAREGYRYPKQKALLYGVTGCVSILAWGLGSFGSAFLIMNFFHAFQYFAIVWWSEKESVIRLFGLKELPFRAVLAFLIFICVGFGYGFWRVSTPHTGLVALAFSNVVSILHFWYDGFIWSVRKKQIPQ